MFLNRFFAKMLKVDFYLEHFFVDLKTYILKDIYKNDPHFVPAERETLRKILLSIGCGQKNFRKV